MPVGRTIEVKSPKDIGGNARQRFAEMAGTTCQSPGLEVRGPHAHKMILQDEMLSYGGGSIIWLRGPSSRLNQDALLRGSCETEGTAARFAFVDQTHCSVP